MYVGIPGFLAYGTESWFLVAQWYSRASPSLYSYFETKYAEIAQILDFFFQFPYFAAYGRKSWLFGAYWHLIGSPGPDCHFKIKHAYICQIVNS